MSFCQFAFRTLPENFNMANDSDTMRSIFFRILKATNYTVLERRAMLDFMTSISQVEDNKNTDDNNHLSAALKTLETGGPAAIPDFAIPPSMFEGPLLLGNYIHIWFFSFQVISFIYILFMHIIVKRNFRIFS